jgi:hypothetical protein
LQAKIVLQCAINLNNLNSSENQQQRQSPKKLYMRICDMIEDAEELVNEFPL